MEKITTKGMDILKTSGIKKYIDDNLLLSSFKGIFRSEELKPFEIAKIIEKLDGKDYISFFGQQFFEDKFLKSSLDLELLKRITGMYMRDMIFIFKKIDIDKYNENL